LHYIPPYYGLRDYGVDGQIGLEETPEEYVQKLVAVFREVKRVLKDDGTLWVNIGDTYATHASASKKYAHNFKSANIAAKNGIGTLKKTTPSKMGLKEKDLIGIPWMLAFALRADGWYLRQDIIWHKPNPMPESVRDRCTKSHEYIFLLSKSRKYYYDYKAIQEPTTTYDSNIRNRDIGKMNNTPGRSHMNGLKHNMYKVRNKRDVWSVPVRPFKGAHFATFPEELIKPCVLAGSRENGIVLDPFFGSGTTGIVATRFNRDFIGIELNSDYIGIAKRRLESVQTEMVFA
jgi:DNA modification methylase